MLEALEKRPIHVALKEDFGCFEAVLDWIRIWNMVVWRNKARDIAAGMVNSIR